MSPPFLDEAVAGNHRQRARDCGACLLLGSTVDDHSATAQSRLLERRAREALAGRDELMLRDALVGPAPPVIEERGLDLGHPCAVGIGLGRDVLTPVARRLDGGQKLRELVVCRRVDVDDVERCLRCLRRLDCFHQARQAAAHMDVDGGARWCRDSKHAFDLRHGRTGCIGAAESHGDSALRKPLAEKSLHVGHLRLARRAASTNARRHKPLAGVAEHLHAHGDVTDRDAVIDDLPALACCIPPGYIACPHFQLECRCDAVAHHHPVRLFLLSVLVQIHEARGDDVAGRVDYAGTGERRFGDRLDLPGADAHVAHGVKARFRIHHATVGDHQVVSRRWLLSVPCQRRRSSQDEDQP